MILRALTAHQTPTSTSRKGDFMNCTRISKHHHLLFWVFISTLRKPRINFSYFLFVQYDPVTRYF